MGFDFSSGNLCEIDSSKYVNYSLDLEHEVLINRG